MGFGNGRFNAGSNFGYGNRGGQYDYRGGGGFNYRQSFQGSLWNNCNPRHNYCAPQVCVTPRFYQKPVCYTPPVRSGLCGYRGW